MLPLARRGQPTRASSPLGCGSRSSDRCVARHVPRCSQGDGLKTHSCVSFRRKALGFFAKVESMLYDFYEQ